jgi:hypothetical protein
MQKDMTKKCYYALFDNQIYRIVSTGFNETSRDIVRTCLINFLLLGNFSEEGEKSVKNNTLTELINYYEFSLLKSDVPFEDCKHYDLNLCRA